MHNSQPSHAMTGIELRSAKRYTSALAAGVVLLNKMSANQEFKYSFGTLEDLSQDFKIVSLGTYPDHLGH